VGGGWSAGREGIAGELGGEFGFGANDNY